MLADVTSKIAGVQINIKNVEATTNENHRGRISLTIEIPDLRRLQQVMKSVREVPGVLDVERARR